MSVEHRLHDAALHAAAASVDQSHLAEPGSVGRLEVVRDDPAHVGWKERVQIQRVLDGNARRPAGVGVVFVHRPATLVR